MTWLRSINLYAMIGLVGVGGLIVIGSVRFGVKYERNKTAAEMAPINSSIVETRGKDEVELAAEKLAADMRDKVFASAPTRQKLILDEETARLLGGR